MSYRRSSAALHLKADLSVGERCVLIYLADAENDETGLCCPKMETVGESVGLKRRQVNYIISSLKEKGLITSASNGKINFYKFNFEKAFRCDVKDTSEADAQIIAHQNLDAQDSAHLNNDAHFSAQQGAQKSASEVRRILRTKPGIKPRIKNQEEDTSSPTPPLQSTSAPASLSPIAEPGIGGGGGGVKGTRTIVARKVPTRDEFKKWLNELCIHSQGALAPDGYNEVVAAFDQLTENGWCDANGCKVKDWQRYLEKIARKSIAKWRG